MTESFSASLEKNHTPAERVDQLHALVRRLTDECGIKHRDESDLDGNERMLLDSAAAIEFLLEELAIARCEIVQIHVGMADERSYAERRGWEYLFPKKGEPCKET